MEEPEEDVRYWMMAHRHLKFIFNNKIGTSLAVQWLRLNAPTAGDMGSIPGRGTKIPHATRWGQKINK